MNVVVFGAGAIGSLIGGLLSKDNDVILIARKPHVDAIRKKGLTIKGKTRINVKVRAEESVDKIDMSPDLIILTVKSYDTEEATKEIKKIIDKHTLVLSLQNGIDNIEKIKKYVIAKQIIAGITTHGCIFSKPGVIIHTGIGKTVIGKIVRKNNYVVNKVADLFNRSGIKTEVSYNIIREIWIKAIVNSSINPLTSFFKCKNGYLLINPVLEKLVEKVCEESTNVANALGLNLSVEDMVNLTKEVIKDTSQNYSSMLQSVIKGKRTEIDSINGKIVEIGKKRGVDVPFNELLLYLTANPH